MNALLKTSLICLTLVSTASMASNFAGPEAGVSVTMNGGFTSLTAEKKDTNFGEPSLGFSLRGGYGFDIGNDAVVLLGLDYNATEIAAGKLVGVSVKIKNSWSVSAAPGILLNDKTLGYVKLSYEAGKLIGGTSGDSVEESISGYGYGVGLRTEINKTTFLQTEINQVNYKKFTLEGIDNTNAATIGSVGVVFKF
ncbi:MAG: outer membrane beta-barrel protein [Limnohabitans sp.]